MKHLISIDESIHTIKRKYTDLYPEHKVYSEAKIRNNIISNIGDKKLSINEFKNILKQNEASSSWYHNNKHFFNLVKEGKDKKVCLSIKALRVHEILKSKGYLINESMEDKFSDDQKESIKTFLLRYKYQDVPDEEIHKLADTLKIDKHELESYIYTLAVKYLTMRDDLVDGGKADNMSIQDIALYHSQKSKSDYTEVLDDLKKQIQIGLEVEKEHTKNEKIALEIAQDHLFEDPKYYTHLIKAGIADEPEAINKYNKVYKKETKI